MINILYRELFHTKIMMHLSHSKIFELVAVAFITTLICKILRGEAGFHIHFDKGLYQVHSTLKKFISASSDSHFLIMEAKGSKKKTCRGEDIKLFSCLSQLRIKFQLLIKTKIPTTKEVSCFKSLIWCIYHANKY